MSPVPPVRHYDPSSLWLHLSCYFLPFVFYDKLLHHTEQPPRGSGDPTKPLFWLPLLRDWEQKGERKPRATERTQAGLRYLRWLRSSGSLSNDPDNVVPGRDYPTTQLSALKSVTRRRWWRWREEGSDKVERGTDSDMEGRPRVTERGGGRVGV